MLTSCRFGGRRSVHGRRIAAAALASVLTLRGMAVCAQSPPAFDVVSIKPNRSGAGGGTARSLPSGRFQAVNVPVTVLLHVAFEIPSNLVVGGPDWLRTDKYDIEGTPDAGSPADVAAMVRSMLADRFGLVARLEKRPTPSYALLGAATPTRLQQSAFRCGDRDVLKASLGVTLPGGAPACGLKHEPGVFLAGGVTLEALAETLTAATGRPVIDRTGIDGLFDIRLEWAQEPGDPAGVSVFTAVREQLGLRLESVVEMLDTLVVDRIERPTEN